MTLESLLQSLGCTEHLLIVFIESISTAVALSLVYESLQERTALQSIV